MDPNQPQGTTAKPMAKWKQIVLVGGMFAIFITGGYLMRPPTKDCRARTVGKESSGTTCRMAGTVQHMTAGNKNVNALALHDVELDQFWLVDDSGRAAVHFDPSRFTLPADGSRVALNATVMTQEGSSVRRLLIVKIK